MLLPTWESDELSKYFEDFHANAKITFMNCQSAYQRIRNIDQALETACEATTNIKDKLEDAWALFLTPSRRAFRIGVLLTLAGSLPEASMVFRGSLEYALYGHFIARNPKSFVLWMSRHDENPPLRDIRNTFASKRLIRNLMNEDRENGEAASKLYEFLIDTGAHPNVMALYSTSQVKETDRARQIDMHYFSVGNEWHEGMLKTAMRVGVCALKVFESVVPERFAIVGLSDRIKSLQQGL